jgi:hypothetical protein
VGGVVVAACGDAGDPAAPEGSIEGPTVQAVRCRAHLTAGTVSCRGFTLEPSSVTPRFAIVGGQGVYVQLTSTNVGYDGPSAVFHADVTVQNLMSRPLGSPDGSTVTGIRVFFHDGPTVTDGSGTVTVRNADGAGPFTGTEQPYFEYAEMLEAGETTAARTWEWNVPSSVLTFGFAVYVEADMPNAHPTVHITAPTDGGAFALGETVAFDGNATDPEDGALTGGALVWTSSRETGGEIGTGESFARDDLRAGTHRIVLTATDRDGATGADTVEITVHGVPVPGLWQTANLIGGYAFEVSTASTRIDEITYYLDDFWCGDYVWYGFVSRDGDGAGWPITAGRFSFENQLASALRMTVEGFFSSSVHANTWWEARSGATECSQLWPPSSSARPATRLFLRYDGAQTFLSRDPAPAGSGWVAPFPSADSYSTGTTYEWPATLDGDLAGETFTFAGYLKAGVSGGNFLFRVWVDHGGAESSLASHRFEPPGTEEAEMRAAATDDGAAGGVAGDELMVRVTYWGGEPGELHFGHGWPTHVIVPGHVTVSSASIAIGSPPLDLVAVTHPSPSPAIVLRRR